MTVAYDAKRMFYNRTGLGNYSRALFAHFAGRYPAYRYELFPFATGPSIFDSTPRADNVRYRDNRGVLARQWGVTKELDALGVDIYHGLSNELPLNIRRTKARSVVTVHDLIFRYYPETYPVVDRLIYDFKTRRACRQADRIVTVSESTRKDVIEAYGIDADKITVIPPIIGGPYVESSTERSDGDVLTTYGLPREFLLSVGTVEPRKNLESTLYAYAQIPVDDRPPLVIVGKGGKYLRHCKSLAQTLRLSHIHWLDYVERVADLHALYRLALCLVYPSRYEGFGMPVVEALLSGTPVLTSATSSLPEAAGPGGWLVDPTDVEAIKEGIMALTQDAELRIKLAEAGKQHAETRFAPDVLTERLHAEYQSLIRG